MTKLPIENNITIGGVNYRLSKFEIALYQEFIEWAKAQLPNPYDGLAERCKGMPESLAKHMIDRAEQRASSRGTLNDPEIQALANSLPGVKKILSLLFRKYQPSLSEAQISAIIDEGIAEHGADFLSQSLTGQTVDSPPILSI